MKMTKAKAHMVSTLKRANLFRAQVRSVSPKTQR
jgi:hypothetical protein